MGFVGTLAKMTVREALRNRLLWLAAVIALIGMGLAEFLRQVAITETREIQTAVLAALLRASAVVIVSVMVISSVVRESTEKVTEALLSLPEPRGKYVLGKLTGYALVAGLVTLVFAIPLGWYAQSHGILAWAVSLMCELLIIAAVSLFCAVSLNQVLSALTAVTAFYLLARSITAMRLIAAASPAADPSAADRLIRPAVDVIGLLLPAMDRMTQTAWLIQAAPPVATVVSVLTQTAIYVLLIFAASLFDLYRRNF